MMEHIKALYALMDIPGLAFSMFGLILLITLVRWHQQDNQFDFRRALLDEDATKISFTRLGHFICLITSTAVICYETSKGRLSEWLFAGYLTAWAGSFIAAKITGAKSQVTGG